jgi:chromate reductase, NAD(P)H dehydrogenase (quinone)
MRILGISGSLRRGSHNRKLLRAAAAALPPGVDLVEFSRLAELPAFDEDQEKAPAEPVRAFLDSIACADALLIATPEYNASLPGALKNALDWASRPFESNVLRGKPSAVIGASTGPFGAVWAQAELRKVLTTSGADVVDAELPVGTAADAFAADGSLADPALSARLRRLLGELVGRGSAIGDPGAVDADESQFAGVSARVVLQPAFVRAREHLSELHPGVGCSFGCGSGPAAQDAA